MSYEAYDWFTLVVRCRGIHSKHISIYNVNVFYEFFFVYFEVHAQFDKQEIEIMNIFWFLLVF